MKNKKRITTRIIIVIILVMGILFLVQPRRRFNYMVIKNEKTLAIMVEKSEGKYIEYRGKEWPKIGYRFNPDKTSCVDRDKNDIGNLIEYDARQNIAIMKSNRSAYCTLYFDIDNIAPEGSFYIGKEESQEYTNNKNEEIHIKIEDDDAIEYCLTNTKDSVTCIENWKDIPTLEDGWFKTTDYDLGDDGEVLAYLYIKDGAKNISEVKEDKIVLDTIKPECALLANSTGVSFRVKNDTGGSGLTGYIINTSNLEPINYTNSDTVSLSLNTFYGHVKDGAGNTNSCNIEIIAKNGSKQTQKIYTCGYRISSYDCVYNQPACDVLNPNYPKMHWRLTTGNYKCWYATEWKGTYCAPLYNNCNEDWCSGNHSSGSSYCYHYRSTRCPAGSTVVYTTEYNSQTGRNMDGYGKCLLYTQASCESGWSVEKTNYSYSYSLTSSTEVDSCTATNAVTCSSSTNGRTYTICEGSSTRTCPSGTTSINDSYCYK